MFRLCALLVLLAAPLQAQTLDGTIRVIDADTIDIGAGVNIRLLAIDAPEGAQTCEKDGQIHPCGQMATEAARALFDGQVATCHVRERDRYGRALATCDVAGADMGATLVAAGLALTYRDDPTYEAEEKAAILTGKGVWAYEMQDPAKWRAIQRASRVIDMAPAAGRCPIKGNISANGRLYHLPGSRDYARTRIDTAKGERWFCSEGAARTAGWTRAGG
ncbi:MAG: thermonuclease family protein [Pseudomonadota bacterium]